MSAETTAVKRARSESVNSSTPDSKRPNLVAEDVKMDDAANGGPSSSSTSTTLAPPPPSAGLPETPVAAAQAAESIPKPPPSMTIRALIVTQDASIIIGKSAPSIPRLFRLELRSRRSTHPGDQGEGRRQGRRDGGHPQQP
jgi:hypothetical protein